MACCFALVHSTHRPVLKDFLYSVSLTFSCFLFPFVSPLPLSSNSFPGSPFLVKSKPLPLLFSYIICSSFLPVLFCFTPVLGGLQPRLVSVAVGYSQTYASPSKGSHSKSSLLPHTIYSFVLIGVFRLRAEVTG